MGSMMSLRLAEQGLHISLWDIDSRNVRVALEKAQQTAETCSRLEGFYELSAFAKSFGGGRKFLLFSISHGAAVDDVIAKLEKENVLAKGDVVLDGGNEFYRNMERRQQYMVDKGVSWIGMGVSGGYQSARHGPSLSQGGDEEAVKLVMPILEQFAAKARIKDGVEKPCVMYIGPAGSGHYVKMVHNGIEQAMLGAVCEAWAPMHWSLGMSDDEIGAFSESGRRMVSSGGHISCRLGVRSAKGKRQQKATTRVEAAAKVGTS